MHLLELRAHASGSGLASASSVCACSPASGVRSWCAALARKRCWLRLACATSSSSPFSALDQRPRLFGRAGGVDRPQVAGRARLDLVREPRERPEAALHAEPDDEQRGEAISISGRSVETRMSRAQALALHRGLGRPARGTTASRIARAARPRAPSGRCRRCRRRDAVGVGRRRAAGPGRRRSPRRPGPSTR